MKRIILIALCLMCITGTVSAYGLYLSCPEIVRAGLPLKCSVDSDFPAGTTFNIVFYRTQYTTTEIKRQSLTIQENQLTQYMLLDTKGLPGGNYKVEVQYTGGLRSDSVTLQLVNVIDRSGEITITAPMTQNQDEALRIEGSLSKGGNEGIEIEVRGPEGKVFGPQWIGTTSDLRSGAGVFTRQQTVTGPGEYEVQFSDAKGFIGTVTFLVLAPPTPVITTVPTTIPTVRTTKVPTTVPTPLPTTQSPLSPIPALLGLAGAGLTAVFVMKRT